MTAIACIHGNQPKNAVGTDLLASDELGPNHLEKRVKTFTSIQRRRVYLADTTLTSTSNLPVPFS